MLPGLVDDDREDVGLLRGGRRRDAALTISTPAFASACTCARACAVRREVRGIGTARRDDPRPLQLALLDRVPEPDDPGHGSATGHQRGVTAVQELLHARGGLVLEPAIGIAGHDVAMRVDEPRHQRPAAGVEDLRTLRVGDTGGHRYDPPVPDDDRAALDDLPGADDDAGVGDDEILRGRGRSARADDAPQGSDHGDGLRFSQGRSSFADPAYDPPQASESAELNSSSPCLRVSVAR